MTISFLQMQMQMQIFSVSQQKNVCFLCQLEKMIYFCGCKDCLIQTPENRDIMSATPTTITNPMDRLYEAVKTSYALDIQMRDDTIALLSESLEAERSRAEKFARLAREHLKRCEEAEARNDEAERQIRELQSELRNQKRQNAELQLRLEGAIQTPVTNNLNFMAGSQATITEIHDNQNVSA